MRPEPDPRTPKRGWTPLKDLPTPQPRTWFARHRVATAGLAAALPLFLLVIAGVAIGPGYDASAATTIPVEDDGGLDVPSSPTSRLNYEDDYPSDASPWTGSDRDGEGVPSKRDVTPDDPNRSAWDTGTVTRIIDGDTVEVAGHGTVRVIGIDTPEQGECGYDKASQVMADLVLGKTVTLSPGAADDRDRYDRLLRYLDVQDVDAGLELIRRGQAIARYDSRDGYGAHPREQQYISADASSPSRSQDYCPAPAAPQQQQSPTQSAPAGTEPWNLPGPDLDCADIAQSVIITGPDLHNLDADGDGIGCDSYG
jgi:endonuclease YncB( thermonuclease family)